MAETKEFDQIAERLNTRLSETRDGYDGHVSHLVAELLEETSREIGGFGEEGILDAEKGIDLQYINVGDAYNLTILYDGAKNRFSAETLGDVVERYEAKRESEPINLPALTERLNQEREDIKAWETEHPGTTVRDWLHEISREIKCESCGPLGDPPKGTDLWRINLKGRDESLFYDYIDQKFMCGKTPDVMRRKEAEHERYLERLESFAERLNGRIPDFMESDAPDMRHYVTDLLAEANREIRGDGVSASADGERGVYVRFVDKHDNPHIPTILYDGNEGKFLAGSLVDLERKQKAEYELSQGERADRAKFEDMAAKHNATMAASEGRTDEDRDRIAYGLLAKSMVSMGGENMSGMYLPGRGPVINYVDIGERRPFTLVYDRESETFLVCDPHELHRNKEREYRERESAAAVSPAKPEKSYSLGYGHMGSGLVVWNRLEERDGDYVTVAHINPDREVKFFDKNMPEDLKRQIINVARTSDDRVSATRDAPVFNTPPQASGHAPVFYDSPEGNREAYFENQRQNVECAKKLGQSLWKHFSGFSLDSAAVLDDVKEYGIERVSVVLANTMRLREGDARFSSKNREWGEGIALPVSVIRITTEVASHSEIVNAFVTAVRELEMRKQRSPEPDGHETFQAVPKTTETAIDIIRAAKGILGRQSIVTNAQPGRTYTGEMIRVGDFHAVQKIAPDMGIVHNLGDIKNAGAMLSRDSEKREVRVSYDDNGKGSAKPVPDDMERKKGIGR
jgi:hypothetical protein